MREKSRNVVPVLVISLVLVATTIGTSISTVQCGENADTDSQPSFCFSDSSVSEYAS